MCLGCLANSCHCCSDFKTIPKNTHQGGHHGEEGGGVAGHESHCLVVGVAGHRAGARHQAVGGDQGVLRALCL